MKLKITKRDILFFFLGLLAFLFIDMIVHWNENAQAFKEAGVSEMKKIEKEKS